jgi:DNA-binding CsgD family transcriptional regulator
MQTTEPQSESGLSRKRLGLTVAAALQIVCMLVFLADLVSEREEVSLHTVSEFIALCGLVVGSFLAIRELRRLVHRNKRVELALNVATGAFQLVIEQHFDTWSLTTAERDVALLSIKGTSLADIARLRNTREGTVKAQNASIYRKAGVTSRAELVTVVIEDLVCGLSLTDMVQSSPDEAPFAPDFNDTHTNIKKPRRDITAG